MKKRFLGIVVVGVLGLGVWSSCNKTNSSLRLPSMMQFVLSQNWRLDTVIFVQDEGDDTLTMREVPGFATSRIKFFDRQDSSFVFTDVSNPTWTTPDNSDSVFRYTYGKWAISPTQDSLYLYSQDTVHLKNYARSWVISKNDSTTTLYAEYVDTVGNPRYIPTEDRSETNEPYLYRRKKVVFVKSTFY